MRKIELPDTILPAPHIVRRHQVLRDSYPEQWQKKLVTQEVQYDAGRKNLRDSSGLQSLLEENGSSRPGRLVSEHHRLTRNSAVFSSYRKVFADPRLRLLVLIGMVAKMPGLGISAVLILHVVESLQRGFTEASTVAALWTAGAGISSLIQGRGFDRYGLRTVLGLVVAAQAVFWGLAHVLSFPALLAAAFIGGLTTFPAFTVVRLALANSVTEENRHTAYAVDSITTDLAYMVGPSIGIVLAAQASPATAFVVLGSMLVLGGIAYLIINPPLQAADAADGRKPRLGDWLSPRMVGALVVTTAASISIIGFEVAAIGALQKWGQLQWSWLLLVVAGVASIVGGVVYGALRTPPSVFKVTLVLGFLCVPMGLATDWYWLCLLAVPANLFVAPALSATATSVSMIAPEGSKGVAMGAYASALLVGNVAGSPLAGSVLDRGGPMASFAAFGLTAAALAVVAYALDAYFRRRRPKPGGREPAPVEERSAL